MTMVDVGVEVALTHVGSTTFRILRALVDIAQELAITGHIGYITPLSREREGNAEYNISL